MKAISVGDSVVVVASSDTLSDLEADMRSYLADRYISGRNYDRVWLAINNKTPFVVHAIDDGNCELGLSNRGDSVISIQSEQLRKV